MSLLGAILDPGIRQPSSCLIEVGPDARDIATVAALVMSVEITASRTEATTGSIVIEDRRIEVEIAQPAEELVVDRTMIDRELLRVLDGQALSIRVPGIRSPLVEMLVHLFGDTGLDN